MQGHQGPSVGSPNPYAPNTSSPYGTPPAYGPPGAGHSPYGQAPNPYAAPAADAGAGWGMGMHGDQFLASRGNRFAGSIVDGLVYMVGIIPGILIAAATDAHDETIMGLAVLFPMLIIACVQWYLVATTGQSLAKRWLGMKIVKTTGEDVDFVSGVLLRSWVPFFIGLIPGVGHIFGLVDPLMIFGEEHRCLHDRIASTKVISV